MDIIIESIVKIISPWQNDFLLHTELIDYIYLYEFLSIACVALIATLMIILYKCKIIDLYKAELYSWMFSAPFLGMIIALIFISYIGIPIISVILFLAWSNTKTKYSKKIYSLLYVLATILPYLLLFCLSIKYIPYRLY